MARVHRIGQTRPVHVYRFCSSGTVEERVQLRAEKKLYLDQMVNRGATAGALSTPAAVFPVVFVSTCIWLTLRCSVWFEHRQLLLFIMPVGGAVQCSSLLVAPDSCLRLV